MCVSAVGVCPGELLLCLDAVSLLILLSSIRMGLFSTLWLRGLLGRTKGWAEQACQGSAQCLPWRASPSASAVCPHHDHVPCPSHHGQSPERAVIRELGRQGQDRLRGVELHQPCAWEPQPQAQTRLWGQHPRKE